MVFDFQKLASQYNQALLEQVVPFWLTNSPDRQCGGYFDILSATGSVIESDKYVTQQALQSWSFAWLYNTLDRQPVWLDHAQHGAAFLSSFAHTDALSCNAQLDRRGRPTASAIDVDAGSFTAMAYAQLHRATGNEQWATLAHDTFAAVLEQHKNQRAQQAENLGGNRQLQHLSQPVAVLKMILEVKLLLDEETIKQHTDHILQEILVEFVDRRTDTLREYILPEGAFINTPQGRRINAGLSFQTTNYLLDFYGDSLLPAKVSAVVPNRKLAGQAVQWSLRLCQQAWDVTAGGLVQFLDFKQQPVIYPDWQQKWTWVHLEAMNALLKGYAYTRQPDCLKWFKRIHDYTFHHFPDVKQAGWHLAIHTDGQPLLLVKSLPEIGCYSLIRCLAEIGRLLPTCEEMQTKEKGIRAVYGTNTFL